MIPSLPTSKLSSSSNSTNYQSSNNSSETKENNNTLAAPIHSIQLRKSLFQQEIPLHYHSTFSTTHLLSQIKNASLFQHATTSNTNNSNQALIGNNHRLVQLSDHHFVLTTVPKPKQQQQQQQQQNTVYVDRYAKATEIDVNDREMLTEVASVLNKIIYYVTLNIVLDENIDTMNQVEVLMFTFLETQFLKNFVRIFKNSVGIWKNKRIKLLNNKLLQSKRLEIRGKL